MFRGGGYFLIPLSNIVSFYLNDYHSLTNLDNTYFHFLVLMAVYGLFGGLMYISLVKFFVKGVTPSIFARYAVTFYVFITPNTLLVTITISEVILAFARTYDKSSLMAKDFFSV